MGIVRSIQKGEAPAGKFSKAAQDAAKKMKKSSVKKYAKTKHDDLPTKKEGVQRDKNNLALYIIDLNKELSNAKVLAKKHPKYKKYIKFIQQDIKDAEKKLSKLKEERDYKAEYKKFQSSTKAKKYRAELNKYNRQKGTYGNGDGKDASHKGGKIVGFEAESKNRGRAEKSRLKKEADMPDFNPMIDKALDEVIEEYTMARPKVIDKIAKLAKANKYGTVDGTQMNGKTAKQIVAIYNHPKMKRFKKAMDNYSADEFANLTIKLPKVLGIKVESVNESKEITKIDTMLKDMIKKVGKKDRQAGTKLMKLYKDHWVEFSIKAKQHIDEGTCGYGLDGELGEEPAGPHLMKKIKAISKKKEKQNEETLDENPAAIAAAQRMVVQNKAGKKISVMTAKNTSYKDKDPQAHKKAKSIFQRIKDKFKKKNESITEGNPLELNKLKDAIKMFQKKIKKQGRVTNARDEEHLERLMKIYNDMGGRKIKENSESLNWLQEKCWKGYEKKGMKTMFGKRYPNCVKKTK